MASGQYGWSEVSEIKWLQTLGTRKSDNPATMDRDALISGYKKAISKRVKWANIDKKAVLAAVKEL
jgi:hypothetical protein